MRKQMRLLFLALPLAVLFSGCNSLGLATPKGFDQQLAQAYGVHTAVISATATALMAGTITSAEAQAVQVQALNARTILDTAKAAENIGNTAGAANNLTLAVTALTAIQSYLNNQGKTTAGVK